MQIVSLPIFVGSISIQPFASIVISATEPLIEVVPSHKVVVTTLPGPKGSSKQIVSIQVMHSVSIIVSVGLNTVI